MTKSSLLFAQILMFTFLVSPSSHAAKWLPNFLDYKIIEIDIYEINGKARDETVEIERGDVIELLVFEGQAYKNLKLSLLNTRRAKTIEESNYFNEMHPTSPILLPGEGRGGREPFNVGFHRTAAEQMKLALNGARLIKVTAGVDVSLRHLMKMIRPTRYSTPNDGIAWMRDYVVPPALVHSINGTQLVEIPGSVSCQGNLAAQK